MKFKALIFLVLFGSTPALAECWSVASFYQGNIPFSIGTELCSGTNIDSVRLGSETEFELHGEDVGNRSCVVFLLNTETNTTRHWDDRRARTVTQTWTKAFFGKIVPGRGVVTNFRFEWSEDAASRKYLKGFNISPCRN